MATMAMQGELLHLVAGFLGTRDLVEVSQTQRSIQAELQPVIKKRWTQEFLAMKKTNAKLTRMVVKLGAGMACISEAIAVDQSTDRTDVLELDRIIAGMACLVVQEIEECGFPNLVARIPLDFDDEDWDAVADGRFSIPLLDMSPKMEEEVASYLLDERAQKTVGN